MRRSLFVCFVLIEMMTAMFLKLPYEPPVTTINTTTLSFEPLLTHTYKIPSDIDFATTATPDEITF
jgi:hypothetical protein